MDLLFYNIIFKDQEGIFLLIINNFSWIFCGILALLEDLFLLVTALLSSYALFKIWGIKN